MNTVNNKILVLDFDHTCYDTDLFLAKEIEGEIFFGINTNSIKWRKIYKNLTKSGYTIERHIRGVSRNYRSYQNKKHKASKIAEGINFSRYLYPDTKEFISKAKKLGYTVILLSFGEPSWQNKKVFGSGIGKMIDTIQYTKVHGSKARLLGEMCGNSKKIVYVENNGPDLDDVAMLLPQVKRYLMKRESAHNKTESGIIASIKTKHTHVEVNSFKKVKI
ncbi:MAG: hypothetical protein ACKOW9_01220 [Candidatus Paceibacterota bacterium]